MCIITGKYVTSDSFFQVILPVSVWDNYLTSKEKIKIKTNKKNEKEY